MNHMAITWWASDTMYWLNLMEMKAIYRSECPCVSENTFVLVCVCVCLVGALTWRD